jgi:hypothetical protein
MSVGVRGDTSDRLVKVVGLRELVRDARAVDKKLPSQIAKANKEAAADVAELARFKALSLGGVAAHVSPSIKPFGQQRFAGIQFGGAAYPMAGGANFGAYHGQLRQTAHGPVIGWNQFTDVTTLGGRDRFMYRAISEMTPEPFTSDYLKVLAELVRKIGPLEK